MSSHVAGIESFPLTSCKCDREMLLKEQLMSKNTLKVALITAASLAFVSWSGSAISAEVSAAEATAPENKIPAPTIDTNKDGKSDAWDRDADGKPDAWDINGDGKPDQLDNDGDGKPDVAARLNEAKPDEARE
jgi:hypothetical protein